MRLKRVVLGDGAMEFCSHKNIKRITSGSITVKCPDCGRFVELSAAASGID